MFREESSASEVVESVESASDSDESPPAQLPESEIEHPPKRTRQRNPQKKKGWVWHVVRGPFEGTTDTSQGRPRKGSIGSEQPLIWLCVLHDYEGKSH